MKKAIDTSSEEYYQGWEDGIKECLKLAESVDITCIVERLKEWLGYD
jgi:hypothetical protein